MLYFIVFCLSFIVCLLCYALGKASVKKEEEILDEILDDKHYVTLDDDSRQRLREKLSK